MRERIIESQEKEKEGDNVVDIEFKWNPER